MNQSEVSRAIGKLEGDVDALDKRLGADEQQNRDDHREIKVKVEVTQEEVLQAMRAMEGRLNGRFDSLEDRTGKLETTVSLSAAWFKALKLVGAAVVALIALKTGDARDLLKEAWKAIF